MERKYGLKLTDKGGKSWFDKGFVYPDKGEVREPDADYISKDACGRGIHIAFSLSGGLSYFGTPAEIRLVELTGKLLGKDKSKARYASCTVLCLLPNQLYKDYRAEIDQLEKIYQAKRDPLDKDYWVKIDQLDEAFMRKAIRYYMSEEQAESKLGEGEQHEHPNCEASWHHRNNMSWNYN